MMLTAKPAILAMGAVAQQQVASAANFSVACDANLATRETDLKAAFTAADAASGSSVITLTPNCVYTLFTPQDGNNGLQHVAKTLTIEGNNATITRDSGAADFRILDVISFGNLTLNHVTISGGAATNITGGGGIANGGGTLSVNSSTITGNTAKATGTGNISAEGGGILTGGSILNGGTTTLTDSVVSSNQVTTTASQGTTSVVASGGGIAGISGKGGTLTVRNTTISSNSATANAPALIGATATGGGIAAKGGSNHGTGNLAVNVIGSTINGNTATSHANVTEDPLNIAEGGGIDGANDGNNTGPTVVIKVVNSTITANSVADNNKDSRGGGFNLTDVGAADSIKIVNSTIAGNISDHGGVSSTGFGGTPASVTTTNTIVASNTGKNCEGPVTDGGHNISFPAADTSCANTFAQGDPVLGALVNNGGLTKTMALGTGSAAIDTADRAVCVAAQLGGAGGVDQRAFTRTEVTGDTFCDIGAFEVQPVAAAAVPGLPRSGVTTSPVLDARGLPPWAPVVPAAIGAAALVGAGLRRRSAEGKPQA